MPIASWKCGACGNQNAPLNHFAITDCGLKVHPSFAASVLRHDREHYGRGLRAVEVSDCFGCPRALGLSMTGWACDPTKHKAAESGTSWHAAMEGASKWSDYSGAGVTSGYIVEQTVHGVIDGVQVVGRADVLIPSLKTIRDWKGKESAEKAKKYGLDEYIGKLSLYAELTEQDLKWRPTRGIIDFHDHKGLEPVPVELWPLNKVLEYRPMGGEHSVRELMKEAASVRAGGTLPMTMFGESMQIGAGNLCHFCDHRQACRGF